MFCPIQKNKKTLYKTAQVITIAPIVLDVMNLVKTMHRWYQAMGAWTFAVRDYYKLNFTSRLDDPVTTQMFDIVDVGVYPLPSTIGAPPFTPCLR